MNLHAHYDAMRRAALPRLAAGTADLDPLLDAAQTDTRRGITLLTRPPAPITAAIEAILADFQHIEPAQYYYPASDMHLTILSIIACYPGFRLGAIDPAAYHDAVGNILAATRPFRVTFSGLTASPGGILVQGFPQGQGLHELRAALRDFFQRAGLQQSIDQRYSIQTAHATVLRFRQQLANPDLLVRKLAYYQRHFIGSFEVTTAELVYNDWYQRAEHTISLGTYQLAP